ncbi:hypothetical protein [cf. Phormidesmis sp. LEGE 11477]|uniref:hypothetical protein n=1 Tax=cf. Phormidesmis sp. LEGE 11477 TaxID=1828680 RepID=UPI001880BB96|nr:hypothetical protein [cf. Phormidesmis sp. LEGE 11477]MBE9061988.1 hypothetical protein [cf. Phormidesmis sp. LEGE 11477]
MVLSNNGLSNDGLVRDRFQGGLIGLWLLPVALHFQDYEQDLSKRDFGEQSWESGKQSGDALLAERGDQMALSIAIARHFTQIDIFLHSPQHLKLQYLKTSVLDSVSVLDSLPVLLRYHSDYIRRCGAVLELIAREDLDQNVRSLMQMLVLGDVLSMVLSGSAWPTHFPSIATLEVRASDCGLSPLQRRDYIDLWLSLGDRMRPGSAAVTDAVTDAVIEGIAIALTYPNDYCAAVYRAQKPWATNNATIGSAQPVFAPPIVTPSSESATVLSSMMAGIVAGAAGGRESLPVLWQILPNSKQHYTEENDLGKNNVGLNWQLCQVINLANGLFDQWAGVVRKSRTIIAR